MVTRIFMRKNSGGVLKPADEEAHAVLQPIRNGSIVSAVVKQPRNLKFHKKFFALIDVAYSNQERYTNKEEFRKEVIIEAGYYTLHHHHNGQVSKIAKSISFAAMDDIEFGTLFNASIDAIIRTFLPGTDPEQLAAAVEEIIQFSGNSRW